VLGVSRTDSGVHARGNLCVFDTETRIPPEKLCLAINQSLPEDIRIQAARMLAGEDVSLGAQAAAQAAEEQAAEEQAAEQAAEEQAAQEEQPAQEEEAAQEEQEVKTIPAGSKARVLEAVNMRSSASIDSDSITMLYGGDEVEVVEDAGNGWSKITHDGETGYIKTEFIEEMN